MVQAIYLRRKGKVILEEARNATLPPKYISSLLKNIESLGYTFTKSLTDSVSQLSIEDLEKFYLILVEALKLQVGAHVNYLPMYPNFPTQVMEASDAELYLNAVFHYFGDYIGKRILPMYSRENRQALEDATKLKSIDLGSKEEFENLFTMLLESKVAFSDVDKKDVEWFIHTYQSKIINLIPAGIPSKENMAFVGSCLITQGEFGRAFLDNHCQTVTDILRVAVALSKGDVSLAENTKFISFKRSHRKMLLQLLEQKLNTLDDVFKHKETWIRLGERLHPFEYKTLFPKCFNMFDIIRNGKPYQTFYGKVEAALQSNDSRLALSLLQSRPGELARRLDRLFRSLSNDSEIADGFNSVADEVSSTVLIQVLTHFQNRNRKKELRVFFPKGNVGKAKAIPNTLPDLKDSVTERIVSICRQQLLQRFQTRPSLGKVFIDERLRNFTVPFSQRSASKTLRTVSRGSRMKLPDGNTIRFFIWWMDGKQRTDIDLSAVGLDEHHGVRNVLSYFNLKEFGGYHSGDITSAPNGASEFIDIDRNVFLLNKTRYIVMSVNSFTQQPFCDLPECFAGLMLRQYPNSGEIYEPQTVEIKIDLTAATRCCIPLIIDLQESEMIWCDLALTKTPSVNNVKGAYPAITILAKAMSSLVKMSLYELFQLHAESRGRQVFDKIEADTIFALEEGITPFDTQAITSKFL